MKIIKKVEEDKVEQTKRPFQIRVSIICELEEWDEKGCLKPVEKTPRLTIERIILRSDILNSNLAADLILQEALKLIEKSWEKQWQIKER